MQTKPETEGGGEGIYNPLCKGSQWVGVKTKMKKQNNFFYF